MTLIRFLVLSCLLVPTYDVSAARLDIPLRVSLDTLREALSTQLASYRDGPCRYLRLRPAQLQLQAEQGRLRLAVPGRGALGVPLSGQCQTAATWQGTMHFTLEPHIDSRGRLRVRIVDSRLGNARGGAAPVIWDLGKRHLHPQLERFSYDLGASREALSSLLRGAAPAVHAPAMEQALQQLQVLQPQVERAHVMVPIALEIPDAWLRRRRPRRQARRLPRPSSRRWKKRSSPGMPSSCTSSGSLRSTARIARCACACSRCCWTAATSFPPCLPAMRSPREIRCARCSSKHGMSCAPSWSMHAMRSSSMLPMRSPRSRQRRRVYRSRPRACASSRVP